MCCKDKWEKLLGADEKKVRHAVDEILKENKVINFFHKKEEKKKNHLLTFLAIIGGIVAIAVIAFAVYKFFIPDYLEDFEDDFDDDFDNDFFDDDDDLTTSTTKPDGDEIECEGDNESDSATK